MIFWLKKEHLQISGKASAIELLLPFPSNCNDIAQNRQCSSNINSALTNGTGDKVLKANTSQIKDFFLMKEHCQFLARPMEIELLLLLHLFTMTLAEINNIQLTSTRRWQRCYENNQRSSQ